MRAAIRQVLFGQQPAWTPYKLFASGEQGAWYDPSDWTTLYQNSAGTTPVTAVEQPVGLMLDKSKGLVLGPELVTNGDFSNGTTGWSANTSTLSVVSGQLRVTSTGVYGRAVQGFSTTIGRWYRFTATATGVSGTITNIYIQKTDADGGTGNLVAAPQGSPRTITIYALATAATTYISLVNGPYSDSVIDWDNISVRELAGNHAFQGTTLARPTLSARKNMLVGTATLSTQTAATIAGLHVLSFWGTGSVTLSGTATGTLTGTGVNDRVYLEFTATTGTLTLTVSGSVTKAQLEMANEAV